MWDHTFFKFFPFNPETNMTKNVRNLLLASTAIGFMLAGPAHAAGKDDAIKALQAQMNELQKQLTELQAQQKTQADASKPKVTGEGGKEILPGVKMTLGGYVEAAAVWREKNQTQEPATSWNGNAANTAGIPFDNNGDAHRHELRGTARNTRLSLKTEGEVDKDMKLLAYIETDFSGAAPTANAVQTNSYNPRLRHGFAEIARNDWGMNFVAGQTWSLTNMNSSGIETLKTVTTNYGLEAGYLPGIVIERAPQLRLVKSFADNKVNLAFSAEDPEVSFAQVTPPATITARTTGQSTLNTQTTYSTDLAPDLVAKAAVDTGFGHYELFGLMRFFQDTNNTSFNSKTAIGGGGGAHAYVPVLNKKMELQASVMGGSGVGRYTAGGLPDIAFQSDGTIDTLNKYSASIGVIGHPDPTWDLFVYAGYEKIFRDNQAGNAAGAPTLGYGSYSINGATGNSSCYTGAAGTCYAQTSSLWQINPGLWKRFYKGNYGTLQAGASYSLTRRNAFDDANGINPHAYQSVVWTALRYSPF
jgi:hypothetical protein